MVHTILEWCGVAIVAATTIFIIALLLWIIFTGVRN